MSSGDTIELKLPARPEYMSLVRLTTSGIGQRTGLNIDDIEDIKLAVTEACISIMNISDCKFFNITYRIDIDRLEMTIEAGDKKLPLDLKNSEEEKLGLLIIESLMDEVLFDKEGVRLIKYRE